jgi:hypothetical protein
LDKDVAARHGRADLGTRGGGGFPLPRRSSFGCEGGFRSSYFICLAHVLFQLWLTVADQTKTHGRFAAVGSC